jgi:hypothetical protein
VDVVYLYSLIKALRHLQDDKYFHTSYGINAMHNLQLLEDGTGMQSCEVSVGEVEQEELINEELELLGDHESDEDSEEDSEDDSEEDSEEESGGEYEDDKGEGSSKRPRYF